MDGLLKRLNLENLSNKQIWLSALFILSGFAFWYLVYLALNLLVYFWALVVLGLIWIVFAGLAAFFLERRMVFLSYGVLTLFLFLFAFRGFVILGIVLFLLSVWWAHNRVEMVRKNSIEFRPFFVSRKFFPVFLTGLALLLAFMWQGFMFEDLKEAPQIAPRVFSVLFAPAESILEVSVPGYKKGMTLEDAQKVLAEAFLPQEIAQELFGFGQQPPTESQQKLFNLTLEEFTLFWLNNSIAATVSPYLGLAPIFIILALFLVLKLLFLFLKWIALPLLILAIKVMLWYNILVVKEVQITAKTPVLE